MIIFGASGHGKVVFSANPTETEFFFDDNPLITRFKELPVHVYDANFEKEQTVVVAIGNNKVRHTIVQKIKHIFTTVIAQSSWIDTSVNIGEGSQLLHGVIIQSDTHIGRHTIVNTGATIDHDCSVGDFCHIAPNATLCGNVSVGEGTLIGAGSVIIPGIKIGKWCTIGAGTVVLNDVSDHSTVVGNPGRTILVNE
jgi:sugar O-acyltransferase (sialic acid O-acetyltransferase NeuD family)